MSGWSVLTCPWHERDAQSLAQRLGASVVTPAPDEGSPDLAWPLDGDGGDANLYSAGDRLPRRWHVAQGPVWKTAPIASLPEVIASSAWDGEHVYVAGEVTRIHGRACPDSIRAIDPSTGRFAWERCVRGGDPTAALTAVPGVVFESAGSILYGLRASDGAELFSFQDTSFNLFYAPATVAGGTVYVGNSDGKLFALSVGGH